MARSSAAEILPGIPDIEYDEIGAIISPRTPLKKWYSEATRLQKQHRSFGFYLGDLFLFGIQRFGDAVVAEVVDQYSADTITRNMRTCRNIPYARRRKGVGFTLHQAVEGLPVEDQDELLELAQQGDWFRETMRMAVRERKGLINPPLKLDIKSDVSRETPEPVSAPSLRVIEGGLGETVIGAGWVPEIPNTVVEAIALLREFEPRLPRWLAEAITLVLDDQELIIADRERALDEALQDRQRLLSLATSVRRSRDLGFNVSPNCMRLLGELEVNA